MGLRPDTTGHRSPVTPLPRLPYGMRGRPALNAMACGRHDDSTGDRLIGFGMEPDHDSLVLVSASLPCGGDDSADAMMISTRSR